MVQSIASSGQAQTFSEEASRPMRDPTFFMGRVEGEEHTGNYTLAPCQ